MKGQTGTQGSLDVTPYYGLQAEKIYLKHYDRENGAGSRKNARIESASSEAAGKWKAQFQPDYWHGLVDIHTGKIIKYAAMNFYERKRRNLITYPYGLCWKRCDPPDSRMTNR
ncbi:hypothetical protein EBZ80_07020 [bacterium]|nr:hypothetical protein [bacterium]